MNATIALTIIGLVIVGTAALGLLSVYKIKMDPQQFIVGGRSFGAIVLWLLMAGEVYTSFTFLGAAGWAYDKGAPAFYILCFIPIGCILRFFLFPPVWRTAREYGLLTGADYYEVQYQSRWLGRLVALVGVVFLVPYITLQLTGIEILLEIAGYGSINSTSAAGVAFGLIVAFVGISGLRGMAWASLVKGTLILGTVLFAGIILPCHFFGSPAAVIDQVLKQRPDWMTLRPGANDLGTTWFVSSVLLSGCGAFMWPHSMAAGYAARSEDAVRHHAVMLPFYQVVLLLMYFAGFTALLVKPGLKGAAVDQCFLLVVQETYPSWVLGIVAAAGCLAALVPAAAQLLAAASTVSRNLFVFSGSPQKQTALTRLWIVSVAVLAFGLWLFAKTTIVGLLLVAYNGMTQVFPGFVLSVRKRPPTACSVGIGIIIGLMLLIVFAILKMSVVFGVNVGLVAVLANALCVLAVDLVLSSY